MPHVKRRTKYMQMPGTRGDDCPVSWADSPDGFWTPTHEIVIPNGPED